MKKTGRLMAMFIILCMAATLFPANVAFAETTSSVFVRGVEMTDISYAVTNAAGTVTTDGANVDNWNVKFDTGTLILKDATISEAYFTKKQRIRRNLCERRFECSACRHKSCYGL
ncbi:MAG: hypothetical protein Q4C12_06895 [Clostridia bacterium]|nr:hypothetical protein [Clostridia bacterium]